MFCNLRGLTATLRFSICLTLAIAPLLFGGVPQAAAQTRVVTIGDSWAHLVAPSLQTAMNTFHPGVSVANQSYGGGTAAQFTTTLNDITNRVLSAGPDADIVWLSAGGNDMLAGVAAGGWYAQLSPAQRVALYDTIGQNVQTVANHILSIRPDIQVVIEGYDYINVWDGSDQNSLGLVRANLGLGKTGVPVLDLQQNADLNQAFRDEEARKQALGDSSSRIHYINNMGFLNTTAGYSGYFGSVPGGLPYPPEAYPAAPTRPSLMSDPIHLNTNGYNLLALRAEQQFFNTALQPGQLATSTTTLNFGATRVGTSQPTQSVTLSNAGLNFTKVENLLVGSASGDFAGGGSAYNPLFRDPTLGSDTASASFSYLPSARGNDLQQIGITSDNGSANLTLQGLGVGPEFAASETVIDLGTIGLNQLIATGLDIQNSTTDGDLGALTDLSLLSAQILGPDAGLFNLLGFTPGMVLAAGETLNLMIEAQGVTPGTRQATLLIQTDQNAAFGGVGSAFSIPLVVTIVPEPSSLALSVFAALTLVTAFSRRKLR